MNDKNLRAAVASMLAKEQGGSGGKLEAKLIYAVRVPIEYRRNPKWKWGAAAEFLYRELIYFLELGAHEELLLDLAKSRPGRKEESELAERIWKLSADGKSTREIQQQLGREGHALSIEAIEAYRKGRRQRKHS
jgi:hypothetical protein